MKDSKNERWTLEDIAYEYQKENPEWALNKCWEKAKVIYKELNKLNHNTYHNNKIFFQMNTPFSFYYDKDSEFSDIYETKYD